MRQHRTAVWQTDSADSENTETQACYESFSPRLRNGGRVSPFHGPQH